MKILYEDLQFWSVTAARDPFTSAYQKAKNIYEDGFEPLIEWHQGDFIEVKKGEPRQGAKIKDFKQSKKRVDKKKKKIPLK